MTLPSLESWHRRFGPACPLLTDEGRCLLYSHRPLACREHLAVGSSADCGADYRASTAAPLPLPISVAQGLSQLSTELEPSEPAAIFLPLALGWTSRPRPHSCAWPAVALAGRLLDILARQAQAAAA